MERSVDCGAGDAEQLGELGGGVAAGSVQLCDVCLLVRLELGLLAPEPALAFAAAMPSRVRIRMSRPPRPWPAR